MYRRPPAEGNAAAAARHIHDSAVPAAVRDTERIHLDHVFLSSHRRRIRRVAEGVTDLDGTVRFEVLQAQFPIAGYIVAETTTSYDADYPPAMTVTSETPVPDTAPDLYFLVTKADGSVVSSRQFAGGFLSNLTASQVWKFVASSDDYIRHHSRRVAVGGRVEIPKPDGGVRKLGSRCGTDGAFHPGRNVRPGGRLPFTLAIGSRPAWHQRPGLGLKAGKRLKYTSEGISAGIGPERF